MNHHLSVTYWHYFVLYGQAVEISNSLRYDRRLTVPEASWGGGLYFYTTIIPACAKLYRYRKPVL